jgi:hypothetical protein
VFDLNNFIQQGHQKVIEHYRWLRDTAQTEVERERFRKRMLEEYAALKCFTEQRPRGAQRAA